jgi:hypothetical protein
MKTKEQAAHMMRWMEDRDYNAGTMIACLEFAVELFRVVEETKAKEQTNENSNA